MLKPFFALIILAALLSTTAITYAAPTTYTVTKTADTNDGVCNADCSLREAITNANTNAGLDTIAFNIAPAGAKTIQVTSPLATITDPLFLNATTQPGYINKPIIELDGSLIVTDANGLVISAGGSTISGLIINRFTNDGIVLNTNGGNTIIGNYIGTDAAGATDQGNDYAGILIENIPNNTIGGTNPLARNVISGNENGIIIRGNNATNNVVLGNYVGTNAAGTAAISNDNFGVVATDGSSYTTIGGASTSAGNLISGNNPDNGSGAGVGVVGTGNRIQGNKIGTDFTGVQPIPNGGYGVWLEDSETTLVGGEIPGAGNIIAFNNGIGIMLRDTPASGTPVRNAFLANNMHSNTGLGIDVNNDGVTLNDPNDVDDGTNGLQNFPVITAATRTASSVIISGTLNSLPNNNFRIEFFANDTCDSSAQGEGQTYLGAIDSKADGSGNVAFTASLLKSIPAGKHITATATLFEINEDYTSEFSACFTLVNQSQSPQTFNVTKTADTNDGVCNADCSLREAITAANTNAGSTINIPAGTYTLTRVGGNEDANATGDLDINANVTISGVGSSTTIIDANSIDRVFHITGAYTVSISGVTIRNGISPGAGIGANGGGVYNNGVLTLTNCAFNNNRAPNGGGTIDTGTGGGLYVPNGASAQVNNCSFIGNTAVNQGGGIGGQGQMVIQNSTFTNNSVDVNGVFGGGGIFASGQGSLSISNSTFTSNSSLGGGAIWNYTDSLTISNTTFTNNTQGALYTNGGSVFNSTFSGNSNTQDAGAIISFGDPLTVSGSTFVNNTAGWSAGAIFVMNIMSVENGVATITNSTFTGNSSPIGGAILVGYNGDTPQVHVNITHSTFSDNPDGGAVYLSDNAVVTMHANILNNSTGGNCRYSPNPGESLVSTGYNISSDSSCNANFTATADANTTNPLLDILAHNGGPTQTIALQAASAAINRVPSGLCTLNLDQRGQARPSGNGCDSGAYERVVETPQNGSTLTVNTTGDSNDGICGLGHCSLREAISAANAASGKTINIPAGTYIITRAGADEDNNATGDFDIKAAMTLTGAGAVTTIIDGNDLDRIFHITGNFVVNLSGVTVRNGYVDGLEVYGGGIFNAAGTLNIHQSTITDNRTDSVTGGGVASWMNTTTTITESTLSNNYAEMGGGGLANYGVASITDSLITNNSISNAAYGGGGVISAQVPNGSLTITSSTITNNTGNDGGGVHAGGTVTITDSTFTDNYADNGGSALFIHEELTLSGSTFIGNEVPTAAQLGGAIFIDPYGKATINNSTFDNNLSSYGGAIWNYSQLPNALEISRSTFTNHTEGAVNTMGGTITDSTFSNNSSTFYGAAISSYESLIINRSTFVNNIGDPVTGVGAVWLQHGDNQILNSTFSSNSGFRGGAVYVGNDLSAPNEERTNLTIIHSTFSGNIASDSGGGIYVAYNGDITFRANILNANTGGNCALSMTAGGTITSTGYNISSGTSCNPYFTAAGDLNNTNPLLAALADNGGLTQTIALQAASPAIDRIPSANCTLVIDQRNFVRPSSAGCDSGAFEYDGAPTHGNEAPQRNYYTTATPTLTWTRVTTAATYIIEVDTDRNFTAPFAFRATAVTAISITTTALPDGTYYWRVRAVNANGSSNSWSAIDTFVIDA